MADNDDRQQGSTVGKYSPLQRVDVETTPQSEIDRMMRPTRESLDFVQRESRKSLDSSRLCNR